MAKVEVKDHNIWIKHIVGDDGLRRRLEALRPSETITLLIEGQEGLWQRMGAYRTTGYATPGLTPIGPAKEQWRAIYLGHRGSLVDIRLTSDNDMRGLFSEPDLKWEEASESDRTAAWTAFKALRSEGWRSEAPYGARDELHERD